MPYGPWSLLWFVIGILFLIWLLRELGVLN
jgi:hypothetical protein